VNRGGFTDGDENTTIVDLDGSLSGIAAMDSIGDKLPTISLNNLGINASSNSVDECLSEGAEDNLTEGRPTSAMVPSALGQLEFEQLYPPSPKPIPTKDNPNPLNALAHKQLITVAKNTIDFDALTNVEHHQQMPLTSRNGLGDWEPKVTDGYGYTITAGSFQYPSSPSCKTAPPDASPGISSIVDLTLTDIVNASEDITPTHPFYVQLGICYTNKDGSHPDPAKVKGSLFSISKGFRSYGGGNVIANPSLNPYWGGALACNGLDNALAIANGNNPLDTKDMPKQCPAVSSTGSPVFKGFNSVGTYAELTMPPMPGMPSEPNGPPILNNYFYDKTNGWLFLWVAQTEPNAQGPSPLGVCTGNKATDPIYCPSQIGESFYVCPAEGCPSYRVVLNDPSYQPGPSNCGNPYSADQGYEWPAPPTNENTLVLAGTSTPVVQTQQAGKQVAGSFPFPHYAPSPAITCPINAP
jgi:hypothetical protein